MIIIADSTGTELRAMDFLEYDFEVGDFENSFLVTGNRAEWDTVPDGARIYIPGTEYGGIYTHLETDTKNGTFGLGGYTWRGMLQNKIIQPASASREAGGVPCLNPRRGLTLLSPVCRDPAIGV